MVSVSVQLENNASVARDHLANERTYLAWLRTSIAFASAGIAVAQLFRLPGLETFSYRVSTVIGVLFVCLSMVLLVLGVTRYFRVQTVLRRGMFPVSRGLILFSFALSFSMIVVATGLIIKAGA